MAKPYLVHPTHGMSGTTTYTVWKGIIGRCYCETNSSYSDYGGRGITVDKRWHKFENFLADMGERPKGKFLERIDNNGPYFKENCIWATRNCQDRNKRNNVKILFQGEVNIAADWARKFGVSHSTIMRRFNSGKTIDKGIRISD